jgi:hypothetical protein
LPASFGFGCGEAAAVAEPEPLVQSISCSSLVHPFGAPVTQEIAPSLPLIWMSRTEPLFVPVTTTQARTLSAVTGESVLGEEELDGGGGGGAAVVVVTVTVEVVVTVDVTVDAAGAAVVAAAVELGGGGAGGGGVGGGGDALVDDDVLPDDEDPVVVWGGGWAPSADATTNPPAARTSAAAAALTAGATRNIPRNTSPQTLPRLDRSIGTL